ncbi:hypothetical protein NBRC3188_2875 [Acetobacter pasteurianus NBRC 3188]|uniref:Uncharacterized protein n=2 Tax=Acetobacter pasteurianus TaxID=438 RepID=A0A401WXV6_ACEPA|nr:hypothetical protein NBRC3188_2875 [Acetobacter pasteurianus NBRC 3188]
MTCCDEMPDNLANQTMSAPTLPKNELLDPCAIARFCTFPINSKGEIVKERGMVFALSPRNQCNTYSALDGQMISAGDFYQEAMDGIERACGRLPKKKNRKTKISKQIVLPILAIQSILLIVITLELTLKTKVNLNKNRDYQISEHAQGMEKLKFADQGHQLTPSISPYPIMSPPPSLMRHEKKTSSPQKGNLEPNTQAIDHLQKSIVSGEPLSQDDYNALPKYLREAVDGAGLEVSGRKQLKDQAKKNKISIIQDDGAQPDNNSTSPGEDPYGISNMPPPQTTAATGSFHIPMPGGNDLHNRDDAENFGLGKFPSAVSDRYR